MTTFAARPAILLVSGERFFLKEVALDPAVPVATQVEMALEESSPFPLTQLYHGFVVSPDRRLALGFAAYRRRFAAEEVAEWPAAAAVLPDFLALLGPPPDRPLIVVHVHPTGLNAVAWDGRAGLPAVLAAHARAEPAEADVTDLVTELRRRPGLADAEVRRLDGPAEVNFDEEGGAILRIAGGETARFTAAAVATADVRDKSFLEEKRRDDRRRRGWSRALMAAGALLLVAVALDLAAGALGFWARRQRDRVADQAAEVSRIETAQTLATRIEDLSARQEQPLEWLSLVSAARPRSVQFTRVVSNNDHSLTIDAQTADAAAVGAYEAALRARAEIAGVTLRDIRSREGVTSFVLAVKFQPAWRTAEGGRP